MPDVRYGKLPNVRNLLTTFCDPTAFYNEVSESLQRGYEEKINGDNLVLEINSSKYAYNVTMKEVNMFVIKAMLSLPAIMKVIFNNLLLIVDYDSKFCLEG